MTRNGHRAVSAEIPRTAAAALALEVAATFSSPALLNHCQRSFVFAVSLGEIKNLPVETEVLYVAAMLHDLGLEPEFDNAKLAFEVAGGHVAWVFAAGAGWPAERRTRVGEIIVAHMRDTDPAIDPEGYLLAAATALDIVGEGFGNWPRELLAETVSIFPRLDLTEQFTACFADQADRKPQTAAAASVRNGLAERMRRNPLDRPLPNAGGNRPHRHAERGRRMQGMIPAWGGNLLELDQPETDSGGGAVAAYVDDRLVLDAWWGESRPGVPWASDTLCVSMSTAKVVIATAVAALADRGELEVGRPVADYWPAFGSAGKRHVTVADVLKHRSGTPYPPGYRRIASQDDADLWEHSGALAQVLAESAPAAPIGEIAYGVSTLGLIIGEVVERATGRSLDLAVRELIAGPLGLRLTRTPGDADLKLAADLRLGPTMTGDEATARYGAGTLIGKALLMGDRSMADVVSVVWNTDARRRTGNWSYAVHSDARSLARLAATLAAGGALDGVRIVSEKTLARHLAPAPAGYDAVWGGPTRLGLGYSYGDPGDPAFQPGSFGHHGIGGAVLMADPARRIGFAFIPNRWERAPGTDPRAARVIAAIYEHAG